MVADKNYYLLWLLGKFGVWTQPLVQRLFWAEYQIYICIGGRGSPRSIRFM